MHGRDVDIDLPLDGIRVVEVGGGIPAAMCARLLRGHGADVVRLEGLETDEQLTSDELAYLVAGKRRIDGDVDLLADLIAEADVVIEDRSPGTLGEWGIDLFEMSRDQPKVITSVTPFGQTGPLARWVATNAVQFAVGGLMSLTGEADREPLVTGGSQAHMLGGLQSFAATLTALYGTLVSGQGEWLDLSMQELSASMIELYAAMTEYDTGEPVVRAGNSVRAVWGVYPCADGYAGVCCLGRQVPAFFELLGEPVLGDPRFEDRLQMVENNDELLAHVMGFMLDHTKDELVALSPVHKVPFGAVRTPAELLSTEGLLEREFFEDVVTPDGVATVPARMFPGLGWVPADRLHAAGEDTESVVGEWLGGAS